MNTTGTVTCFLCQKILKPKICRNLLHTILKCCKYTLGGAFFGNNYNRNTWNGGIMFLMQFFAISLSPPPLKLFFWSYSHTETVIYHLTLFNYVTLKFKHLIKIVGPPHFTHVHRETELDFGFIQFMHFLTISSSFKDSVSFSEIQSF